jgi:hypothetical protein
MAIVDRCMDIIGLKEKGGSPPKGPAPMLLNSSPFKSLKLAVFTGT